MKSNTVIDKCIRHINWLLNSICGYLRFKKKINSSTCIFISHNGDSAGGAPVVLFELMRTLKNEQIIFLCEKPGGIIQQCKEENIPAYCTYLLQNKYLAVIAKANAKAVVVNTLAAHNSIQFFNQKSINIPVLWWIHEERGLIERYRSCVPNIISKNIHISCVSHSVEKDLIEICPQCDGYTDVFYYGCKDLFEGKHEYTPKREKFVISVIGRICSRKNQLQVVKAYNCLPKEYQENIFVDFIAASCDESYKKELDSAIDGNYHFAFKGPIKREAMPKIYEESSLIVCSSLDDPLPVVVTESLMLMCPVITSSRTGQFSIIENGVNGFSYDVNSLDQLCQAIKMVYEAADLQDILKKGRETYLQYFLPDVVNGNFKKLLLLIEGKNND